MEKSKTKTLIDPLSEFSKDLKPGFVNPDLWVVNSGMWEAREQRSAPTYKEYLERMFESGLQSNSKFVFRLTTPIGHTSRKLLSEFTPYILEYNALARKLLSDPKYANISIFDAFGMNQARTPEKELYLFDGMHLPGLLSKTMANTLLHTLCHSNLQ